MSAKRVQNSTSQNPSKRENAALTQELPLAEKSHWESVHTVCRTTPPPVSHTLVRLAFGQEGLDLLLRGGLKAHIVREALFKRFLVANQNFKILEVGSAPGWNLVSAWEMFKYEPYGVEYSQNGYTLNQDLFKQFGLNPGNLLNTDFFDQQFQEQFQEVFDVVLSHGFIEHFTDVRDVIRAHINVLKPGGKLVITIPNLQGLNRDVARLFHPGILEKHNLSIMDKKVFCDLFAIRGLSAEFCGYLGSFSLTLANVGPSPWRQRLFRTLAMVQSCADLLRWRVCNAKHVPTRWLSPYLAYVGTKQD